MASRWSTLSGWVALPVLETRHHRPNGSLPTSCRPRKPRCSRLPVPSPHRGPLPSCWPRGRRAQRSFPPPPHLCWPAGSPPRLHPSRRCSDRWVELRRGQSRGRPSSRPASFVVGSCTTGCAHGSSCGQGHTRASSPAQRVSESAACLWHGTFQAWEGSRGTGGQSGYTAAGDGRDG